MKSKNVYKLPVRRQDIKEVYSLHDGLLKNAIDFEIQEGKPILAALEGKVIFVRDNFKLGRWNKKFWDKGNRIVIKHSNREYSAYEHLKHKGAVVKKGETVVKGQLIAYCGNTGYSKRPHLHFEVFIYTKPNPNPDKDFITLKPRFRD